MFHRLFIAISIPDGVKDEMERVQAELKRTLPDADARWTKRAQFHLTLKFLGNVPVDQTDQLIRAVQETGRTFPALLLRAAGIGAFPDRKSPRVIWAGVGDRNRVLGNLQLAVERAVGEFTAEKAEKEFSGHVTLARVRLRPTESQAFAKFAARLNDVSFGEWTANEVEILRSELLSDGARYTVVARIPLGG